MRNKASLLSGAGALATCLLAPFFAYADCQIASTESNGTFANGSTSVIDEREYLFKKLKFDYLLINGTLVQGPSVRIDMKGGTLPAPANILVRLNAAPSGNPVSSVLIDPALLAAEGKYNQAAVMRALGKAIRDSYDEQKIITISGTCE
jgi:hypothetical protein